MTIDNSTCHVMDFLWMYNSSRTRPGDWGLFVASWSRTSRVSFLVLWILPSWMLTVHFPVSNSSPIPVNFLNSRHLVCDLFALGFVLSPISSDRRFSFASNLLSRPRMLRMLVPIFRPHHTLAVWHNLLRWLFLAWRRGLLRAFGSYPYQGAVVGMRWCWQYFLPQKIGECFKLQSWGCNRAIGSLEAVGITKTAKSWFWGCITCQGWWILCALAFGSFVTGAFFNPYVIFFIRWASFILYVLVFFLMTTWSRGGSSIHQCLIALGYCHRLL